MLIAIEGIDGAGKRTQTDLLKQWAQEEGLRVASVSFPRYGETFLAKSVADYLNGHFGGLRDMPAEFPALLYAGDRFESRGLLGRLLAENDLVVADRYVASNLAYQACKLPPEKRGAFIAWLQRVEYGVFSLPRADVTVYLDVPVDVSYALVSRKGRRSYTDAARDLHERNRTLLTACRGVYLELVERQLDSQWERIECVDERGALRSAQAIHLAIRNVLGSRLASA